MKKMLSVLIAVMFVTSMVSADTFTASGTLSGVSTMTTRVFNTPDGSDNLGPLGFNGGAGATFVSSLQAIEINFDDNNIGAKAINIYTANPGGAEGMVGETDDSYSVPMMWVIQNDPIAGGDNNYMFTGDTLTEAFIVDIANPDRLTYGNMAYSIDGLNASLANFPNDDGAGEARAVTDGQIWAYFGCNYTGKPAQNYTTTNLTIELITLP